MGSPQIVERGKLSPRPSPDYRGFMLAPTAVRPAPVPSHNYVSCDISNHPTQGLLSNAGVAKK